MIGNILITVAFIASIFTIIMYYYTNKGYTNTLKLARLGYHITAVSVIAASAMLLHAILTHQYQFKYVYSYSNSELPMGLLMSTFYAGQEGSFMLWLLFTAIIGLILLEYTSKRDDLEPRVMMVFTLATSFLLLMVSPVLKSPFTYIWADPQFIDVKSINSAFLSMPFLQSFFFSDPNSDSHFVKVSSELVGVLKANGISLNEFIIDGKGLNPLLQNFWMQIHPPMLFVGFSMATVPFAFAFAALMKNKYDDWVKQSLPWVLTGTMILGLAIMLGGYWAYGVLGWGGYWGWDPVENSSLVPWIIGVASIHTLLVQKKTQNKGGAGKFVKTNLILCIMTYLLVLYSTFLTRSGILGDASVHSFVDPGMMVYLLLVLFVMSFTLLGFGAVAYRWKFLTQNFSHEENVLSRELALFTGAVTLIASAIIILFGTSAPIFGTSVEIRFYDEMHLPIGIIIGLINGFSLLLKWKSTNGKDLLKSSKNSFIGAFILTALIVVGGGIYDFPLILFVLSSAFALFVNAEIAIKIFRGRKLFLGAYVAHVGIALFFLGVIFTGGYTRDMQVDLPKNETVSVLGHDLTFKGYDLIENGKKYAFNIEIKDGGSSSVIAPVMYIAEFNNSLMREPDILSRFTNDFYISPLGYTDGTSGEEHNHDTAGEIISLTKGQSTLLDGKTIRFNEFVMSEDFMSAMQSGESFFIGAKIDVLANGKTYSVEPRMINEKGQRSFTAEDIPELNLSIKLENLDASGKVNIIVAAMDEQTEDAAETTTAKGKEVITVEASIKPFIGLVWLGVIVMVAGFIISAVRRTKESQA
ncbi:MAG: cytochrome c biogenesis protein CcsA [Melioribacteraceae bacterium]|nr:cytochrome c biogenesis protein CcsA [Melioribacteraceae bacterium]MCF8353362.1 cytochrome c biogenesis protein CcsA [Melioribacteraceae bacterium]MCF8393059.1 cytochrome c biogenesis protein CcsA [Melioribacteraceae bacterium]MCF8419088.1 cytochrome c biogenesis protein CcsA [Melioribacteraceae bacterium]